MPNAILNVLSKLIDELVKEEQKGSRFFYEAAEQIKDKKAKQLFRWLAAEENKHIETLEIERERIQRKISSDTVSAPTSQLDYDGNEITVFNIGGKSFADIEIPDIDLFKANDFAKLFEKCDLNTIVKLAMKIEYDNFKYLIEVMKKMPTRKSQQIVLNIALEEKNHFIKLKKLADNFI